MDKYENNKNSKKLFKGGTIYMKTQNIEDIIKVKDQIIEISEINKIIKNKDIHDIYRKYE